MDQGSSTHHRRTMQVNELKQSGQPTHSYLWLLTVCCSDILWTVIAMKAAAAVAEMPTISNQ